MFTIYLKWCGVSLRNRETWRLCINYLIRFKNFKGNEIVLDTKKNYACYNRTITQQTILLCVTFRERFYSTNGFSYYLVDIICENYMLAKKIF